MEASDDLHAMWRSRHRAIEQHRSEGKITPEQALAAHEKNEWSAGRETEITYLARLSHQGLPD